ncbi:aspartyl-phosphate phosphatase Spo0E family protein [Clostridium sp. YIM B02569]|uniref:aspartyl-phosphate phosphatase Spo0E family protein n=1 Tax=Clostridium sp. YIM B02569 TaxID=2911967 RepID=UPI001EEB0E6F|nr:aspartyl-phosphate phosphatase Spo0E family protein [Clostridium sp. YIM B02569]
MSKYRLHVDETVNRLNFIDIETSLNEKEVDALLTKIEKDDITSALDLKRRLEAQGVQVKSIKVTNEPYYRRAETLEIEELEDVKREGIMVKFKACDLSKSIIEQAIDELRERMHISISVNGPQSDTTIKISQQLDELIVVEMRSRL